MQATIALGVHSSRTPRMASPEANARLATTVLLPHPYKHLVVERPMRQEMDLMNARIALKDITVQPEVPKFQSNA